MATLFWLPPSPASLPSVKLIQFASAGVNNHANHPIYTDSDIPLCSANGVHGPQIAEWVVMMDLVHSHNYTALYDNQKQKIWDSSPTKSVSDRVGKRVGILGYGSIGRQGMYCNISLSYISMRESRSQNNPPPHLLVFFFIIIIIITAMLLTPPIQSVA